VVLAPLQGEPQLPKYQDISFGMKFHWILIGLFPSDAYCHWRYPNALWSNRC
jgi:hypothetical protein